MTKRLILQVLPMSSSLGGDVWVDGEALSPASCRHCRIAVMAFSRGVGLPLAVAREGRATVLVIHACYFDGILKDLRWRKRGRDV